MSNDQQYQQKQQSQHFANPLHPLDLNIYQFDKIRQEFEKIQAASAAINNQPTEGILIEITWNDFQLMLDKESNVREIVLDWFMFDLSTKHFAQVNEKFLKPKHRDNERIFQIEKMLEMIIDNKLYFLILFDDHTLTIYDALTYQIIEEIQLFYHFDQQNFFHLQAQQDKAQRNNHSQEERKVKPLKKRQNNLLVQEFNNGQSKILLPGIQNSVDHNSNKPVSESFDVFQSKCLEQSLIFPIKKELVNNQQQQQIKIHQQQQQQSHHNVSVILHQSQQQAQHVSQNHSSSNHFNENKQKNQTSSDRNNNQQQLASSGQQQQSSQQIQFKMALKLVQETYKLNNQTPVSNNKLKSSGELNNSESESYYSPYSKRNKKKKGSPAYLESIAQNLIAFIGKLKTAVNIKKKHFELFQQMQKSNKIYSEDNEKYIREHKHKLHQIWKKFQDVPVEQSYEFTHFVNEMIKQRTLHTVNLNSIKDFISQITQKQLRITSNFNTSSIINNGKFNFGRRQSKLINNNVNSPLIGGISSSQYGNQSNASQAFGIRKQKLNNSAIEKPKDPRNIANAWNECRKFQEKLNQLSNIVNINPRTLEASGQLKDSVSFQNSMIEDHTQENEKQGFGQIHSSAVTARRKSYSHHQQNNSFALHYGDQDSIKMKKTSKHNNLSNISNSNIVIDLQSLGNTEVGVNYAFHTKQQNTQENKSQSSFISQGVPPPLSTTSGQSQQLRGFETTFLTSTDFLNRRNSSLTSQQYIQQQLQQQKKGNNKQNKLHIFSLSYCQELQLLAVSLANREVQIYQTVNNIILGKKQLQINRVLLYEFQDVILHICFNKNRVTQQWNLIFLFQNRLLQVLNFSFDERKSEFALSLQPFFQYNLNFEPDLMQFFPTLGITITAYTGEVLIIMDHATTDSTKTEAGYIIFFNDKFKKKNGKLYSITTCSYSSKHQILVFGTLNGKLLFHEPLTKRMICKQRVSQNKNQTKKKGIFAMQIYEEQNQVIVISQDLILTCWDVMRQQCLQVIKVFDDDQPSFKQKINTIHFSPMQESLYIGGNELKIFQAKISESLSFQKNRTETIYNWRQQELKKQATFNSSEKNYDDNSYQDITKQHKKKIKQQLQMQQQQVKIQQQKQIFSNDASKMIDSFSKQQEKRQVHLNQTTEISIFNSGQQPAYPKSVNQSPQKQHESGKQSQPERKKSLDSSNIGQIQEESTKMQKSKLFTRYKDANVKSYFDIEQPNVKQVFFTEASFILFYTNNLLKVVNISNFKVKYSLYMNCVDTIINVSISNKVIAIVSEKGDIILKNLYTDEVYQTIQNYKNYPQKINKALFLPTYCEHFLACSTQEGDIIFLSSVLQNNKKVKNQTVAMHTKNISQMNCNDVFLSSYSEDNTIVVWNLHSFSKKHDISLPQQHLAIINNQLTQMKNMQQKEQEDSNICNGANVVQIYFSKSNSNIIFYATEIGYVYEFNAYDGELVGFVNFIGRCPLFDMNEANQRMVSIDESLKLSEYSVLEPDQIIERKKQQKVFFQKDFQQQSPRTSNQQQQNQQRNTNSPTSESSSSSPQVIKAQSSYKSPNKLKNILEQQMNRIQVQNLLERYFHWQGTNSVDLKNSNQIDPQVEVVALKYFPQKKVYCIFLNKKVAILADMTNAKFSLLNYDTMINIEVEYKESRILNRLASITGQQERPISPLLKQLSKVDSNSNEQTRKKQDSLQKTNLLLKK